MEEQATLLDLPAPKPRVVSVADVEKPVAKVIMDIAVPGFEFPLDYLIPADLSEAAKVGMSVQVRLAGSRRYGWIVDRVDTTTHQGKLAPILKVNYRHPQVSPYFYETARLVANRYCSTVAEVISSSLPKRVAAAEKEVADFDVSTIAAGSGQTESGSLYIPNHEVFSTYGAGKAWLDHLSSGGNPRAVWDCLPSRENDWAEGLVESAIATLKSGRNAILLAPTAALVERLMTVIRARGLASLTANLHSEVGAQERYRNYLRILASDVRLVVGTQSAALAPLENVGLYACFDDGDKNYLSRGAPYFHSVRVIELRAKTEDAAFLAAGFNRTLESQLLVENDWAAAIVPTADALKKLCPKIMVPSYEERFEVEGEAGLRRFPTSAYRLVKQALQQGPVLFQVPRSGYVNAFFCARCNTRLRCEHCGGPAVTDAANRIRCQWCERPLDKQRCRECGGVKWYSRSIGSSRTAQELGRLFKGYPVTISGAGSVMVESVDDSPRLVVCTHGAEPVAKNGYSAVVILDAYALLDRPELWAPLEASRRFFNALSLIRAGGSGLVLGVSDPHLARALVTWDRGELARVWLEQRRELEFPPTSTMISVDGPYQDLLAFSRQVGEHDFEVIGPQELRDGKCRLLLRSALTESGRLLQVTRDLIRVRSQRKEEKLKVVVDPTSLW